MVREGSVEVRERGTNVLVWMPAHIGEYNNVHAGLPIKKTIIQCCCCKLHVVNLKWRTFKIIGTKFCTILHQVGLINYKELLSGLDKQDLQVVCMTIICLVV